jgi:tetratricopeptide (TPR) repeat protein
MNAWRKSLAYSLALTAVAAGSALAQGKGKGGPKPEDKCSIALDKPDEVKSAESQLALAQMGGRPEDQQKRLKNAVGQLTLRPEKYASNQMGHDFVLGQALSQWATLTGNQTMKKGDVGYLSDKDQTIDLLATADSLFNNVEKSNPDCADQTSAYRQGPWVKMINGVGPLLNANNVDSASKLLDRSMVIYRGSPYTYYFKGQIAQRKENYDTAAAAYTKAAELAATQSATDTGVAGVKEFAEFSAAYMQYKAAEKATGDQQKTGMAKAAELYQKYLKDYPSGPNTAPAQAGLTAALKASGNTEALASNWQQMAASPASFSDLQLYDAATQAFQANQIDLAVKLADAAQQANPWLRAGLYNAANIYWKANQFAKMLPVAKRLVQIDPNNPDNFQLEGIAYQGLAKAAKDPKVVKAYNDSLNTALTSGDKMPIRVTFTEFSADGTKHKIAGTVENLGTTAKTANLKVDFLDKQGNVVGTQTTTIPVDPKGKKDFTIVGDGANIAAYRYAPIS